MDALYETRPRSGGGEYSRKTRIAVGVALIGIAVGIYVALEVNPVAGLLFIVGAYFFGYMAYRTGPDGEDG